MGGRRDYTRWDYDDETEITMEDALGNLAGSAESLNQPTFPAVNVLASSSSPIRSREGCKRSRKMSIKEKSQLLLLSGVVLLVGFMVGFGIGVRRESHSGPRHSKHFSSISDPLSTSFHEHNDLVSQMLQQISAHNIRDNLKTMTKEEHRAGTKEGHEMAIAIRDLWRSYGISVRVEQHKTLLTKTESFNYGQVISNNGTVLFATSKDPRDTGLEVSSPPIMAFSPSADLNGSLVYGHFGRLQDFDWLQKSGIGLNGSIALIRFGDLHPSEVVTNAGLFGISGLIFYPDPENFNLPKTAVRVSSLLHVGQVHEFQKRKGKLSMPIPSHTVSAADAEGLFKWMEGTEKAPAEWKGGLNVTYYLGGKREKADTSFRLKISNEGKTSPIFNVVATIPGTIEYDKYIMIGCSHDSLGGVGAGDPGVGLAVTTEILRAFSSSWAAGWRPRRSILVISWDANFFAASGLSHWLQEHHFEVSQRTVAYIDMTRTVKGNQSLEVFSSPLLKEVTRKAINKIKHSSFEPEGKDPVGFGNVEWKSVVSMDEGAFSFLGNLGVPFIRLSSISNSPKENYPFFHTGFDTFDNFASLVDSDFKGSEAIGRIIAEIVLLLSDSSALPIALHDYAKDIKKEFEHLMTEYHEDFQKANLSHVQLQAAVTRFQLISENLKLHLKDHSGKEQGVQHHRKLRREMEHRILNDKLISVEKAFLTRNSEASGGYKHQIIGYVGTDLAQLSDKENSAAVAGSRLESESHLVNKSSTGHSRTGPNSVSPNRKPSSSRSSKVFSPEHFSPGLPHFFPKVKAALECGRRCEAGSLLNNKKGLLCSDLNMSQPNSSPLSPDGESSNHGGPVTGLLNTTTSHCKEWKSIAAQRISSLVKSLNSVSAIIQSPILGNVSHE